MALDIFDNRSAGDLLREYQTGVPQSESTDFGNLVPFDAAGTGFPINPGPVPEGENPPVSIYQMGLTPVERQLSNTNTEEALAQGFGTSIYDRDYYPGMDVEEQRAREQSGLAKIGSGLAKSGVTAVATGANVVLGTLNGAFNVGRELISDPDNDGRSFMQTLDAGTNNWVSERMNDLQRWSEDVFPNYRTSQERSEDYQREWYKHIFTANFIGDSILKNFGFTLGAMGAGATTTKLMSKAMQRGLAGKLMKGAAAASSGDAEADALLKEAISSFGRGEATASQMNRIVSNIDGAAKRLNAMDSRLKLYGSTLAALGEATTEGTMARQEFLEDFNSKLEQSYAEEYNGLEQEILDSGNSDWVNYMEEILPDGTIVPSKILNQKGRMHLLNMQHQVTEKYEDLRKQAINEADRLASTTALLNTFILMPSDLFQFGRMFAGGWNTTKKTLGIKGGVARTPSVDSNPLLTANYKAPSIGGKTVRDALTLAGTEASEEMAQGIVSSGAKKNADDRLTSYNDSGFDPSVLNDYSNWFQNMVEGGSEYLSDIKNWQEGFLGALTGVFGIPGRVWKGEWNGGAIGSYLENRREYKPMREAANKLNELVNSNDFQTRLRGYVRHMKYDNDMSDALIDDDKFAWHNANDKQLIGDVMMFADAGKLNDLEEIVDIYGNISDRDADDIRSVVSSDSDSSDWTSGLNNQDIVQKVKDQAEGIKTTIKKYKDVYDAVVDYLPADASDIQKKELVFTSLLANAYDTRIHDMLTELTNTAQAAYDSNVNHTDNDTQPGIISKYRGIADSIKKLQESTVLPLQSNLEGKDIEDLGSIIPKSNKSARKTFNDLQKLLDEQKKQINKSDRLKEEKADAEVREQAITKEKVEDAAAKQYSEEDTKGEYSFDDIRRRYNTSSFDDRVNYIRSLNDVRDSNASANTFLEYLSTFEGFQNVALSSGKLRRIMGLLNPVASQYLDSIFLKAKNVDELLDLPRTIFPTKDEIAHRMQGPTFPMSDDEVAKLCVETEDALKEAMATYAAGISSERRKAGLANPVIIPKEKKTLSDVEGGDAPQPNSSVNPVAPAKKQEQPSSKKVSDPGTLKGALEISEENVEKIEGESADSRRDRQLNDWFELKVVDNALRDYAVGAKSVEEMIEKAVNDNADEDVKQAFRDMLNYRGLKYRLRSLMQELREEESVPGIGSVNTGSTSDDALADIAVALNPDDVEVVDDRDFDRNGEEVINYYRTSVPEIRTSQAKKIREARKIHGKGRELTFKNADLSDFVHPVYDDKTGKLVGYTHEEYRPTWEWLRDKGAFDYVATNLNVGDELCFIITPDKSLPEWEGEPQIIVAKVTERDKAGDITRYQPLTILLSNNKKDKYMHLHELRNAIMREYNAPENDKSRTFVFGGSKGKTSRVFKKAPGVVEYNTEGIIGAAVNRGYSKDAPLMYIDRRGDFQVLRGDSEQLQSDMARWGKLSDKGYTDPEVHNLRGQLFYCAPSGDGHYVPIILTTGRFNNTTRKRTNAVYQEINGYLDDISNKLTELADEDAIIAGIQKKDGEEVKQEEIDEAKAKKLTESNEELRSILQKLGKRLYLNGVMFNYEYRIFDGRKTPVLEIQPDYVDTGNPSADAEANKAKKAIFVTPQNILENSDSVAQRVGSLNRKINISYSETEVNPEKRKKEILDMVEFYAEDGVLMTNATKLRAKGVDFYFNPWNGVDSFEPVGRDQLEAASYQNAGAEQMTAEDFEEAPVDTDSLLTPIDFSMDMFTGSSGLSLADIIGSDTEQGAEHITSGSIKAENGADMTEAAIEHSLGTKGFDGIDLAGVNDAVIDNLNQCN